MIILKVHSDLSLTLPRFEKGLQALESLSVGRLNAFFNSVVTVFNFQ